MKKILGIFCFKKNNIIIYNDNQLINTLEDYNLVNAIICFTNRFLQILKISLF